MSTKIISRVYQTNSHQHTVHIILPPISDLPTIMLLIDFQNYWLKKTLLDVGT
ncbi:hypothetical protein Hanom_Chr11g01058341 [Helianthus anomalus]